MTEPHVHLVAAARVLVQWGRKRQNVWRDGSSDLLAALGNRYAAFEELTPEPPSPLAALLEPTTEPERSPWDALATFPESERTPAWAQVPPSADVAAPAAAAPPPAPFVAPPPPTPPVTMAPVAPLAPVMSAPAPVPDAAAPTPTPKKVAKKVRGSTTRQATRGRLSLTHLALAAGVILAAVASPSVWRAYHTPPAVVTPTTNGVTIDSYPAGSQVLIDGIDVGKTPFTTTLTVGRHAVELRYRKNVRKIDVDVTAGDPIVARVEWSKKPAPKKRTTAPTTPAAPATPATQATAADSAATTSGTHEPAATRHQLDATTAPADPAGAGDSQPPIDTSSR